MPSAAERLVRADARANHEAILTAAAALFAERGPDVRFEDVAQRAGVGRATMYRHFPTREALLMGLLAGLVDELEAAAARTAPGPDALDAFLREAVRLHVANLPLVEFQREHRTLPRDGIAPLRARLLAALARPLALAREAGTVRDDVTVEDVRILMTMATAAVRRDVPAADRERALRLASAALRP